jgi:hypothetical protein
LKPIEAFTETTPILGRTIGVKFTNECDRVQAPLPEDLTEQEGTKSAEVPVQTLKAAMCLDHLTVHSGDMKRILLFGMLLRTAGIALMTGINRAKEVTPPTKLAQRNPSSRGELQKV